MSSAAEYLKRHLSDATDSLKSKWAETATNHGWDPTVHEAVDVSANDSGLSMTYPPNMADAVMSEEYGNGPVPPKAAMRNFTPEATGDVNKAVYDAFSEFITSKGLL